MLGTVSPGPARPSCAAVIRCQVRPSREVQMTACAACPGAVATPAARKPVEVLFSTHMSSPEAIGVMPCVAASVQVSPVPEVQVACGPTASQPPGPPASRAAGEPSAACPPPGAGVGPPRQEAPPSADTKNCCRTTPSLACEPMATMVG